MNSVSFKNIPTVPSRSRLQRSFTGKKPISEHIVIGLPDKMSELYLQARTGQTAIEAIKENGRKSFRGKTYKFMNEDGEKVSIKLTTDKGTGREYITSIQVGDQNYENIQYYVNGGFAVSNGRFIALDEITPKHGESLRLEFQDDSHRDDLDKDIVIEKGKIKQMQKPEEENICLSCAGDMDEEDIKKIELHCEYDLWFGDEVPVYVETEGIDLSGEISYLGKTSITVPELIISNEKHSEIFDPIIRKDEKINAKQTQTGINIQTSFQSPKQEKTSDFVILNPEFKEEDNPIIRCIMDPAFRKIYGAMYGFIEPEEYEAKEYPVDPKKYEKEPKSEKREEEKTKKENPVKAKTEKGINNKELKVKKDKKELRKPKTPESKLREEKPNKRKLRKQKPKKPEQRISKIKVKEPRRLRRNRMELEKPSIEVPKVKKMKMKLVKEMQMPFSKKEEKFEGFLSGKLKLSKIKARKLKLIIQKMAKELKIEVHLLIKKVKEYFSLRENFETLKQNINKNWILNYTKIKMQKTFKTMEIKIQKLKFEINKKLEEIKVKIKKLNLGKVLKLNEKVKFIRKIQEFVLLYLILGSFKKKKDLK